MELKRLRHAGICFMVAGALSFLAAFGEGRPTFFLFGGAFMVSGIAFLVRSRRGQPA